MCGSSPFAKKLDCLPLGLVLPLGPKEELCHPLELRGRWNPESVPIRPPAGSRSGVAGFQL